MGNTALILAANNGTRSFWALLREGPRVDHHEAAAIGDTDTFARSSDRNPSSSILSPRGLHRSRARGTSAI
jgi:hypothetical protein